MTLTRSTVLLSIISGPLLVLSLGSCSSGSTLTITPNTLNVTAGSLPTSLTATVTGSTAAIAWSLSGPGALSSQTGATTSYTPPTTAASATRAKLTATAGDLTSTAIISISPPPPALTILPKALNVAAGSSASTFTAVLTGSNESISWSLTGVGSISSSTGTATSYTPPANANSPLTATLTASAGSLTANVPIGIPLPITVSGLVLFEGGLPAANATVVIGNQATTTDTGGNFTLSNVAPPYDVLAVTNPGQGAAGPDLAAIIYQGLTRTDPVLIFVTYYGGAYPPNSGQLSGVLSGGDSLDTVGDTTSLSFGSPETWAAGDNAVTANPYALLAYWSGAPSTTGTLHALQYSADSGVATEFKAYGAIQDVTLTNAGTTSQDLTMAPVGSEFISGSISGPPTYAANQNTIFVTFDDGANIFTSGDDFASYAGPKISLPFGFKYVTPAGVGSISLIATACDESANVTTVCTTAEAFGLASNATGIAVTLPEASRLVLPLDSSTGITRTTAFSWTPFANGINVVLVTASDKDYPSLSIVTAATSTTIPDLDAYGVSLWGNGASYSWEVHGVAPYADVDARAVRDVSLLDIGFTSTASVKFMSQTAKQTYQTQ